MKKGLKRFWSLLLVAILVFGLIPSFGFTANAATLSGLSGEGLDKLKVEGSTSDVTWNATGTTIKGTLTSPVAMSVPGVGTMYNNGSATLTLTNNMGAAAYLEFTYISSYTANQGSVSITVNGAAYSAGSPFKQEIPAGKSVVITLNVNGGFNTGYTTSIDISGLKLYVNSSVTSTFKPVAVGGSYTVTDVNGVATTVGSADVTKTQYANDVYKLTATPASGYSFAGWYSESNKGYLSADPTWENATFSKDPQLTAVFIPTGDAIFGVGEAVFSDLSAAVSCADNGLEKKVLLLKSASISGNYTIPKGVTLLIPCDAAGTSYGAEPQILAVGSWTGVTEFRTLTLTGGSITVEGVMEVASKLAVSGGGPGLNFSGSPDGSVGFVRMADGAQIIVNNGGTLYAWGYVTDTDKNLSNGRGSVTVKSGGTVYECFQIADYRGFNATLSAVNSKTKVFPFSQYYIQNIEVPLTLESGANEYVAAALSGGGTALVSAVQFIGKDGMFVPATGSSITKSYLPDQDRLQLDVYGSTALSSLVIDVTDPVSMTVNSSDFTLALTNNLTINIHSGTTSVTQDVAFLPGAQINVGEGAVLKVNAGCSLFVYDRDEWMSGKYVHQSANMYTVKYSPTQTKTRTTDDLVDVILDVNGTIVTDGYIYTTASGAAIISSGETGRIVLTNGAGTATNTYQLTQVSTAITGVSIAVTSARLKNADASFTKTAGAAAGDAFLWSAVENKWVKAADVTITFSANGGTGSMAAQTVSKSDLAAGKKVTLTANTFTRENYHFAGWDADGDGVADYADGASVVIASSVVLEAVWEGDAYFVYVDGQVSGEVAYGTDLSKVIEPPTKDGYTFTGWTVRKADGTVVTGLTTMPAYDLYYTANWEKIVIYHTLTFLDENGNVLAEHQYEEGTAVTASYPAYTKANYTITWSASIPATLAADVEITAIATPNTYTITFFNGTTSCGEAEANVNNGWKATIIGNPSKTADKQYTYTFAGWATTSGATVADTAYKAGDQIAITGDMDLYAVWTNTTNTYDVVFYDEDGKTVLWTAEDVAYGVTPVYQGITGKTVSCVVYVINLPAVSAVDGTAATLSYTVSWTATGKNHVGDTDSDHICNGCGDTLSSHKGGEATCVAQAVCTICKKPYGAKNSTNHTSTEFSYTDNGNGTHTKAHKCCGAEVETVKHTYVDGECICQNVQTFTVTILVGTQKTTKTYTYGDTYKVAALPTHADPANYAYFKWLGDDGNDYYPNDTVVMTSDLTLTAVESIKVTYVWYEGRISSDNTYGEESISVAGPNNFFPAITRENYTFKGWSTTEGGTQVVYEAGDSLTVTKPITLYAVWEADSYTITWTVVENVDGTELTSFNTSVKYGQTIVKPDYTAPVGYEIVGYEKLGETMPAGNLELQITVAPKSYTITWTVSSGNIVQEYKYGEAVTAPANPTMEHYVFNGWVYLSNGKDAVIPSTMPAENLNFSASWSPVTYTVGWDTDGDGDVDEITSYSYNEVINNVPNYVVPNNTPEYSYSFDCWKDEKGNVLDGSTTVSGNVTFTAQFTTTKRSYTIIWKNEGGAVLAETVVEYGKTPSYGGTTPTKDATAAYTYTFAGWSPKVVAVDGDATYTAVYTQTANEYILTFDFNGGLHHTGAATNPVGIDYNNTLTKAEMDSRNWTSGTRDGYTLIGWNTKPDKSGKALGETFTMPAENVTFYAVWELNAYTGWLTDDNGTTYVVEDEKVYFDQIGQVEGDLYYFDENGYIVANKGLVKTVDADGHIHYYYFGCGVENCSAGDACLGEYKAQKSNRHYAAITNGYLLEGGYTTGDDGVIEHIDDTSVNGIYAIDGVKYYLMDGVKVAKGLFMVGSDYYYARSSGALVVNQEYWVSKTNGLELTTGSYKFDAEGRIVLAETKDGFVWENDAWYYYADGKLNYAGLIQCDGPEGNDPGYYYVNSKGKLITGCDYWISKNNDLMKNMSYTFDENGTMVIIVPKSGFYYENDAWYYYVDGKLNYAGLIQCDGPEGNDPGYYYVNSKGMLITGRDYWISKNNDLMKNMSYTFDENGTMVIAAKDEEVLKNGFYYENDAWYYYVDGKLNYAGLIWCEGPTGEEGYYYVNSSCKLITGCSYWISKNNGFMKNGSYTFDANGKMVTV